MRTQPKKDADILNYPIRTTQHVYNNPVKTSTSSRLLELNRQFYQTFALQFSATRQRLQPGVRRILDGLSGPVDILDLGCGNGEFVRELAARRLQGSYTGIDFSPGLLEEARRSDTGQVQAAFIQADLALPGWEDSLPACSYNTILAFAVLHHIPGEETRRRILETVRSLLAPGGQFIHSEWQFLSSPRLKERIQPWSAAGLQESDLDPGDYLLDWRQGGHGLRYVHHFNHHELDELAASTGFTVLDTFLSDGKEGHLGLYQVWQRPLPAR